MPNNELDSMINELKSELTYFFDLWKNSGPTENGSLMNKIKDIERKIAELENMNSIKTTANITYNQCVINLLVQQNKISEA